MCVYGVGGCTGVSRVHAHPHCWPDSGIGSHCIHGAGMGETLRSERDESQLYRAGEESFAFS